MTRADVFAFPAPRRAPRRGETVERLDDGEPGLAARTIARRLSSMSGLFAYLPRGRTPGQRRGAAGAYPAHAATRPTNPSTQTPAWPIATTSSELISRPN